MLQSLIQRQAKSSSQISLAAGCFPSVSLQGAEAHWLLCVLFLWLEREEPRRRELPLCVLVFKQLLRERATIPSNL